MPNRSRYRPVALHHLLKEVERELRLHDRQAAAIAVRRAVSLVAEDIDEGEGAPQQRQLLM